MNKDRSTLVQSLQGNLRGAQNVLVDIEDLLISYERQIDEKNRIIEDLQRRIAELESKDFANEQIAIMKNTQQQMKSQIEFYKQELLEKDNLIASLYSRNSNNPEFVQENLLQQNVALQNTIYELNQEILNKDGLITKLKQQDKSLDNLINQLQGNIKLKSIQPGDPLGELAQYPEALQQTTDRIREEFIKMKLLIDEKDAELNNLKARLLGQQQRASQKVMEIKSEIKQDAKKLSEKDEINYEEQIDSLVRKNNAFEDYIYQLEQKLVEQDEKRKELQSALLNMKQEFDPIQQIQIQRQSIQQVSQEALPQLASQDQETSKFEQLDNVIRQHQDIDDQLIDLQQKLAEKQFEFQQLQGKLEDLDQQKDVAAMDELIENQMQVVQQLKEQIQNQDFIIQQKDKLIEDQKQQLQGQKLEQRKSTLEKLKQQIKESNPNKQPEELKLIEELLLQNLELDDLVIEMQQQLEIKDKLANHLHLQIEAPFEEQNEEIEQHIQETQKERQNLLQQFNAEMSQLQILKDQINDLQREQQKLESQQKNLLQENDQLKANLEEKQKQQQPAKSSSQASLKSPSQQQLIQLQPADQQGTQQGTQLGPQQGTQQGTQYPSKSPSTTSLQQQGTQYPSQQQLSQAASSQSFGVDQKTKTQPLDPQSEINQLKDQVNQLQSQIQFLKFEQQQKEQLRISQDSQKNQQNQNLQQQEAPPQNQGTQQGGLQRQQIFIEQREQVGPIPTQLSQGSLLNRINTQSQESIPYRGFQKSINQSSDLQDQLTEKTQTIYDLHQQINKLQKQILELKEKHDKKEQDFKNRLEGVQPQDNQQKAEQMVDDLIAIDGLINNLEQQLQDKKAKVREYEQSKRSFDLQSGSNINLLQQESRDSMRFESQDPLMIKQQQMVDAMIEKLDDLRADCILKDEEINQLRQQISDLKKLNYSLQIGSIKKLDEIEPFEEHNKLLQDSANNLIKQNETLESLILELENKLAQNQDRFKSLQKLQNISSQPNLQDNSEEKLKLKYEYSDDLIKKNQEIDDVIMDLEMRLQEKQQNLNMLNDQLGEGQQLDIQPMDLQADQGLQQIDQQFNSEFDDRQQQGENPRLPLIQENQKQLNEMSQQLNQVRQSIGSLTQEDKDFEALQRMKFIELQDLENTREFLKQCEELKAKLLQEKQIKEEGLQRVQIENEEIQKMIELQKHAKNGLIKEAAQNVPPELQEQFQKELDSKNEEIEDLIRSNAEASSKLYDLQNCQKKTKNQIRNLESVLLDMQVQVKERQDDLAKASQDNTWVSQNVRKAKQTRDQLFKQQQPLAEKVQLLESQIQDLNEELPKVEQQYQVLLEQVEKAKQLKEEKELQNLELQKELEPLIALNTQFQAQLLQDQEQLQKKQDQFEEMKKQNQNLTEEITKFKDLILNNQELLQNIAHTKDQINDAQTEYEKLKDELILKQDQVQLIKPQHDQILDEYNKFKQTYDATITNLTALQDDLKNNIQQKEQLQDENNKLVEIIELLTNQVNQGSQQKQQLQDKLNLIQKDLQQNQEELSRTESCLGTIKEKLNEKLEEEKNAIQDYEILEQKVHDAQLKHQQLLEQTQHNVSSVQDLENTLKQSIEQCDKVKEQILLKQQEFDTNNQKLLDIENQLKQANDKSEQIKQEIEENKPLHQQLESQLQQSQDNLKQLENQNKDIIEKVAIAQQSLNDKQNEYDAINNKLDKLNNNITNGQQQQQQLENKIQSNDLLKQQLEDKLDKVENDYIVLQGQLKSKQEDLDKLNNDTIQIESEFKQKQQDVQSIQQQIDQLTNLENNLKKQLEKVKEIEAKQDEAIKQVNEREETLTDLQQQLAQKESKLEDTKIIVNKVDDELKIFLGQQQELEERMKDQDKILDELETQIDKKKQKEKQLREEIETIKLTDLEDQLKQLNQLKVQQDENQSQIDYLTQKLEQQKSTLVQLKERDQSDLQEFKLLEDQHNNIQLNIEQYNDYIQQGEVKLQELIDNSKQTENKLEQLNDQFTRLDEEVKMMEAAIQIKEKEILTYSKKKETLDKALEEANNIIAEQQKQIISKKKQQKSIHQPEQEKDDEDELEFKLTRLDTKKSNLQDELKQLAQYQSMPILQQFQQQPEPPSIQDQEQLKKEREAQLEQLQQTINTIQQQNIDRNSIIPSMFQSKISYQPSFYFDDDPMYQEFQEKLIKESEILQDLQNRIKETAFRHHELAVKLQEYAEKENRLANELDHRIKTIEGIEQELQKIAQKQYDLESEKVNILQRIYQYQVENQEFVQQEITTQKKLKEKKDYVQQLLRTLQENDERLIQLRSKMTQYSQETRQLSEQVENVQGEKEAKLSSLQTIKEEIEAIELEKIEKQNQLNDLKKEIKDVNSERDKLQTQWTQIQGKNLQMKQDIGMEESLFKKLKQELNREKKINEIKYQGLFIEGSTQTQEEVDQIEMLLNKSVLSGNIIMEEINQLKINCMNQIKQVKDVIRDQIEQILPNHPQVLQLIKYQQTLINIQENENEILQDNAPIKPQKLQQQDVEEFTYNLDKIDPLLKKVKQQPVTISKFWIIIENHKIQKQSIISSQFDNNNDQYPLGVVNIIYKTQTNQIQSISLTGTKAIQLYQKI
ncbi:hypothetical protein pb186bvf_004184 [Paramecium bursaria]